MFAFNLGAIVTFSVKGGPRYRVHRTKITCISPNRHQMLMHGTIKQKKGFVHRAYECEFTFAIRAVRVCDNLAQELAGIMIAGQPLIK